MLAGERGTNCIIDHLCTNVSLTEPFGRAQFSQQEMGKALGPRKARVELGDLRSRQTVNGDHYEGTMNTSGGLKTD